MNAQPQGQGARGKGQGRTYTKGGIQPRQIKAIHAAIHTAALDDDAYRAMLQGRYGVASCKQLTWRQAEELLDHLNGRGGACSAQSGRGNKRPYSDMDGRPGFATGAQCRLLAAMWAQVSTIPAADQAGREKALNVFCARIVNVAGLRMVRRYQVEKIVKALEAMGAEKKEA